MKNSVLIESISKQEFMEAIAKNNGPNSAKENKTVTERFLGQDVYTLSEAADVLRTTIGTLRKKMRDGSLEYFNDGIVKLTRQQIINYIKKHEVTPEDH